MFLWIVLLKIFEQNPFLSIGPFKSFDGWLLNVLIQTTGNFYYNSFC